MTAVSANAERRFYLSIMTAISAAIILGFAKTVFLRPLFPEIHSAAEPYFYYLHGAILFGWAALFVVQVGLIAARRTATHRRLGLVAFGLAPALVLSSLYAALLAFRRPGGFTDVPREGQLPFMAILISLIMMFALYAGLALALRRDPQSHQRLMIMAAIILMEAAVSRWPFAFIVNGGLTATLWVSVAFTLPLVAWDAWTRHRLHPVTLWGVAGYIAYALVRPTLIADGSVVRVLGSLVGPPR